MASEFWDITLRTIPAVASALAAGASAFTAIVAWRTNLRAAVEANRPHVVISEWDTVCDGMTDDLVSHLIENKGKGRAFNIEFTGRSEGCRVVISQGPPFSLYAGEQDRGMRNFHLIRSDQLDGCDPKTCHQGTLWLTIRYNDVFRSIHETTYVIGVQAKKTITSRHNIAFNGVTMPPGFVYRGMDTKTILHLEDKFDRFKHRWSTLDDRIRSDMKP